MIKTFIFTSAIALAASTAAQAGEIRINVAGKDDATVRAEIRQAAQELCKPDRANWPAPLQAHPEASCMRKAVRTAEGQWRNVQLARSGASVMAAR
ncbi:MAG TPA: hypothetical protein VIO94_12845 [Phenylobacterium sp.]